MNTCDPAQVWTTPHCDNQDHPQLTLQNLTFVDAASTGTNAVGADGGGAVFARGGRLKIVNSRFFRNQCDATGPGRGRRRACAAFNQYNNLPLYVVNSTFGGRSDLGNFCSNGGALSSIGVSYSIYNSLFTDNRAIGTGANPARSGTPGGGNGGAIYNDGNTFDLRIFGSRLANNTRQRGRRRDHLRQQRPHRHAVHHQLVAQRQQAAWDSRPRATRGSSSWGAVVPQITGSTLQP
jgi:hypothetical protein